MRKEVIRLVMFTPRIMVIKMSKITHFMYFLLNTAERSVLVWTSYLSVSERSYLALLENIMEC